MTGHIAGPGCEKRQGRNTDRHSSREAKASAEAVALTEAKAQTDTELER